jgi:hypothetical protein
MKRGLIVTFFSLSALSAEELDLWQEQKKLEPKVLPINFKALPSEDSQKIEPLPPVSHSRSLSGYFDFGFSSEKDKNFLRYSSGDDRNIKTYKSSLDYLQERR